MYEKLEESLMEDLCIPTRSDLHKYCIRTVHNFRSIAALNVAWGLHNEQCKNIRYLFPYVEGDGKKESSRHKQLP